MNKTWILIKTMLKMQYSRAGKSDARTWLYIIVGLFLLPVFFLYINMVGNIISVLHEALQPYNQESLILGILFLISHVVLLFFSFMTVLNAFYFAEDIASFIPFPLQPYQILLGKAAGPFLYLYLIASAFFLPAFFFYGNISDASILYYLYGFLLFLVLPIIPFTIASILLMVMMRYVNIAKNKDRSKVFAGILMLVFIILLNVFIRLNTNSTAVIDNFADFLQEQDTLLNMATAFYPPAFFSTKALASAAMWEGLLFFIVMITVSMGMFLLFIWLGQLVYFKGVLGIQTGNKRKVSEKKLFKKITSQPVWILYIQKELRIIFRTPTFLMQCVIQSLFAPVFIVIILMLDMNNNSLAGFMDSFSAKQSILLLFIVTIFILGSNATSISSISREGKNWHTNLFLPLDPKQVFFSKIATAWIINLLTIGLFLIVFIFLLKIPLITIIMWLILVLTASWFTSVMGTYLDFLEPKLNWSDEQEVFKARFMGLIALLIEFGAFGIIVLVLWNIDAIQGLASSSIFLLISLLIVIGVVHKLLHKKIAANDHQLF
ncbi:hypothetical protein ACFQ3N_04205 [Virgibacillus byunsanensis]|uniref:ABC transporter permease n=1 Tax=Virgibacillus byunsanensis TaxID=570945 RepID=A0ABW3LIX6_9BACI